MDSYFDLHIIQEIDRKKFYNFVKEFDDKIKCKEIDVISKYRYFLME